MSWTSTGEVSRVLARLVEALPVQRTWLLLDEWANVPIDLQPLLADLLRRAGVPAAGYGGQDRRFEQRSHFSADTGRGDYIGIEPGADAAADLDLDDYMVFVNHPEAAKTFFRELLFKHVRAQFAEEGAEGTHRQLRRSSARRSRSANAIDELVRAAEGVPRGAIDVVRLAAMRAGDDPISVEHVRNAARRWYVTAGDYRSIRRAILDFGEFESRPLPLSALLPPST